MANKVKGIPDNSSVLIPRLVCRDPTAAIDFCTRTFNAVFSINAQAPMERSRMHF